MTATSTGRSTGHLTIRDVPSDVLDDLRQEARERGQSMSAVVRAALAEHAERRRREQRFTTLLPEALALRDRIERRRGGLLEDSVALIREDRDR